MGRLLSRDQDRADEPGERVGAGPEVDSSGDDSGDDRPGNQASRAAERVGRTWTESAVARVGLGSRSVVYLTLAVIMIELAVGERNGETDQGGALQYLGTTLGGSILLGALAAGVVCYSSWRWLEAARHKPRQGGDGPSRAKAIVEGICYLPFCIMAIAVLAGDDARAAQGRHYRALSARVLQWPGGPYLVGLVGAVVVGIGAYLAFEGPRRSFCDQLDFAGVSATWRRIVVVLGVAGSLTRGIVFALAGVLVIVAAATSEPSKAKGIDAALQSVAHQPFGRVLLIVAAIGMAAFGLFTLAEAKWRKT